LERDLAAMITVPPALANSRAASFPMPLVAPVMRNRFPVWSGMSVALHRLGIFCKGRPLVAAILNHLLL
jgi:hypothetical protein